MARFDKIDVIFCGQSQAQMAFTGGGETNDTGLAENGANRLKRRLGQLVGPGVTITASGEVDKSYKADTPLFEEFGVPAAGNVSFYIGNPFSNKTAGTAQRSYITGRKNATTLGVVLLFCQSQDAQMPPMGTPNLYATCCTNFVTAILADNATGWGDFAILPVLASMRGGQSSSDALQKIYRQVWESLGGGIPTFEGAARKAGVLRPVYNTNHLPLAAWDGGYDYTHFPASTRCRYLDAAAVAIAQWAGATPQVVAQPRLFKAAQVAPDLVRAYFTAPARGSRMVMQYQNLLGNGGFSLSPTGSVVGRGSPNTEHTATRGYMTVDVQAYGLQKPSRLHFRTGLASASYVKGPNGSAPNLLNRAFAASPPGVRYHSISRAMEDVLDPVGWTLPVANQDYGVSVEFA